MKWPKCIWGRGKGEEQVNGKIEVKSDSSVLVCCVNDISELEENKLNTGSFRNRNLQCNLICSIQHPY